jgi:CDGSH-type Zn-finger protein
VVIRDAGDREGAAVVTPYPDGPLILRGTFVITDVEGREIEPGRRTVALCRCGRSALKPFCDGSHVASFRASGGDERPLRGRRTPQAAVDVV